MGQSLAMLQTLYDDPRVFANHWRDPTETSLFIADLKSQDLVTGDALRRIGKSPAQDYWVNRAAANHIIIHTAGYTIVAVQDSKADDLPPAKVPINESRARIGAAMLEAAGKDLRKLLFGADIFYTASDQQVCVSITEAKLMFECIAYVLVGTHSGSWYPFQGAVCSCVLFGRYQQCQHLLFARGLNLPGLPIERFAEGPGTRKRGRPQGKTDPTQKRQRLHD